MNSKKENRYTVHLQSVADEIRSDKERRALVVYSQLMTRVMGKLSVIWHDPNPV